MAGDILVGKGFMPLENLDINGVIGSTRTVDIDSAALAEVDIIELSTLPVPVVVV